MSVSVVMGLVVAAIVVVGGVYTLTLKFKKPEVLPPPSATPPKSGGGTFKS